MDTSPNRRSALRQLGAGLAAGAAGLAVLGAAEAPLPSGHTELLPAGATELKELAERLARAPRRRDFKSVPMVLTETDEWDSEALEEVIAYRGGPKQVWDNTDIGGPWLNGMRNSLNTQIWAFKHPNFLCASGTHGPAHLALFDQQIWDKYQLTHLAGEKFKSNTLIVETAAGSADPRDIQRPDGAFSPADNNIPALQRRGVVFLACHNAIWEISRRLHEGGANPDSLSLEAIAAELTNHLIPGVVLTPGVVGTLPQLQQAGFHYVR